MNDLKLSNKEKFFLGVSFVYILFSAFPLFGYYVPVEPQYICIVISALLILCCPSVLLNKPFIWLYIYLFVLLINSFLGRYIHISGVNNTVLPAVSRIIIQAAWIMPSLMIATIVCKTENIRLFKIIGYGSLAVLLISFVFILPLLNASVNILREAALEGQKDLRLPGLPDYTLMHSYILMLPGLCLAIKKSQIICRVIFIACTIFVYYIIIRTQVSTSIGLSTAFIIFALLVLKDSSSWTYLLLIGALILLVAAYYSGVLLWFVDEITPYFQGTDVEGKLRDLHSTLINGKATGGTIVYRGELHEMSKNSFYYNPIFGKGTSEVGRHSQILDILGSSGLLALIPFIMIIWTTLKLYLTFTNDRYSRIFMFCSFVIATVYLYSKGIFGSTGWLFMSVLSPALIIAVSYTKFKKNVNVFEVS